MKMIDVSKMNRIDEKVFLLIPLFENKGYEDKVEELSSLVSSSDAETVGYAVQYLRTINPATLFGKGKLDEIKEKAEEVGATTFVCDTELSPAQAKNLSDFFDKKVIDKTALILDIFALNAKTNEGKLQVEVAQLEYLLPRLKGQGKSLSRLGGGIGTRGPGETKLETDRRYISQRIKKLKEKLAELDVRRDLQNQRRAKTNTITVALAGYTNSGKSTLLNALSGSNVLAENKLFATLDPTARKVNLGKYDALFIDTVGFIRDIPTSLIEAFKSTLSYIKSADLVLCVVDASGDYKSQIETTEEILKDIGVVTPIIKVYNKCDKITGISIFDNESVVVSAKMKIGLDDLKNKVAKLIEQSLIG